MDRETDGIIQRRASSRDILFAREVIHLADWNPVPARLDSLRAVALKRDYTDEMMLVRELLLRCPDRTDGLVDAGEGLLIDCVHRTALIDDEKVVDIDVAFFLILCHITSVIWFSVAKIF